MKIYLAGNFPMMTTPPLEATFANLMIDKYTDHNRLYSFYYLKDTEKAIKQLEEGGVLDERD